MTPFPVSSDPKTGFPAVTHRSQRQRKSAFRQNMEAARPVNRDGTIPVVKPLSEVAGERSVDPSDAWRSTMETENARKVALMTDEEREEELRQLSSKFGDIAELRSILGRAKDSRPKADNKGTTSPTLEEVSDEDNRKDPPLEAPSSPLVHNPQHRVATPPRPVLSRRSSVSGVPRTGANTPGTPGVRFAQVTPRDVFTYPSAPTSPRRTTLLIEAPRAEGGENVTKLQWRGKIPSATEPTKIEQTELQPNSTESAGGAVSDEIKKPEPAHPLSQVISSSPSSSSPELNLAPVLSINAPGPAQTRADTSTSNMAFPRLDPIDTWATPEAIRQQYFPNEPKDNPNLAWMADLPEIPDTPVTSEFAYIDGMGEKVTIGEQVGFGLDGAPIPEEIAKEMSAHSGLHHNSRGIAAAAVSLKAAF
ncbi:unnamed protein product [Rhizoctonia solani]|uniref:Uncharacterized protein n=1 Tax=Rhizoctonia solani TaxID=456999 RepID=A0A8H2XNB3_9AGAM|nr:unnamed protein product [Rhizoctonia solani]